MEETYGCRASEVRIGDEILANKIIDSGDIRVAVVNILILSPSSMLFTVKTRVKLTPEKLSTMNSRIASAAAWGLVLRYAPAEHVDVVKKASRKKKNADAPVPRRMETQER